MTIKPKPRCRVRGFVEEMGAFLQRPMCMSLEGERTGLAPITTRTRTGSNAKNLGPLTLRRFRISDYQEWHQYHTEQGF